MKALGGIALALGVLLPWGCVLLWRSRVSVATERVEVRPEMVELPTGSFLMGSPKDEEGRYDDEEQHPVVITRPFAIARSEVTQAQYRRVLAKDPSWFKGDDRPVEQVSWYDAVDYCNVLSQIEGRTLCYSRSGETVTWQQGCSGYRLPTEAEWEYAARAGTKLRYAGADQPENVAWFGEGTLGQTRPVTRKEPNIWGLYDLSGNVYEWVWDCYADDFGKSTGVDGRDPIGPSNCINSGRVYRGGSYWLVAVAVRVASRNRTKPHYGGSYMGFRIARSLP